jgi:hypothetical protein
VRLWEKSRKRTNPLTQTPPWAKSHEMSKMGEKALNICKINSGKTGEIDPK